MTDGKWQDDVLCELTDAIDHVLVGGVVDDDVDGPHVGHGLVDELFACLLGPQITWEEVAFAAAFLNFLLGFLSVALFFGKVVDQAICAFHGIQNGDGTANTAIAAGDDGFLALELAGSLVDLVSTVFGGDIFTLRVGAFHLALNAGRRLLLNWHLVTYAKEAVNHSAHRHSSRDADLI